MSQSASVLGDTPLKRNAGATGVFFTGTLEEQRTAVMNDLGNIPEVTVDFMLNHIVPDSGVDVEHTMRKLRHKGDLLDAGWKEFIDELPKDSADNEQKVFLKMGTIYQRIIDSTKFKRSSRTPTLVLGTSPDIAPVSETSVKTRPDGCGQLNSNHRIHTSRCGYPSQEKGDYHWFNIAYVEEYKKRNTISDLNDNTVKILWSLHHIMNVDCRRRFALGATIENTDTRIWFCCRQIVLVTHRFDFMKEPAKLIQLISSLAYANVTELGYDPTMELFWGREKWNYQITVKGNDIHRNIVTKVYKTTHTIANMSSNLRGRATRVYEAYNVEDRRKSKVVIKDSWVDANRPKEADTLIEILNDASDDEKAMFLTVLVHGVVTIDGREDRTQDLLMNGYLVSTDKVPRNNKVPRNDKVPRNKKGKGKIDKIEGLEERFAKAGIADRGSVEDNTPDDHVFKASIFEVLRPSNYDSQQPETLVTSPDVSTSLRAKQRPRVYGPKAHYRIVFKERGESLHSMSCVRQITLPLVAQAMHDILKALAFLTKKGYVHRDISAGNIIIYQGRAKLCDLEFAKQYESGTSNHIRTGTYDFMAVEVEAGTYLALPYLNLPQGTFSHNPLHDIESVWWVGVWFLLSHYQPRNLLDNDVQEHIEVVKDYGETLFNNPIDPLSRPRALTTADILTSIDPLSFPGALPNFVVLLDRFRDELMTYYKIYKPTASQDRSFFNPDLHHKFGDIVKKAMKRLEKDNTKLFLFKHISDRIVYLKKKK